MSTEEEAPRHGEDPEAAEPGGTEPAPADAEPAETGADPAPASEGGEAGAATDDDAAGTATDGDDDELGSITRIIQAALLVAGRPLAMGDLEKLFAGSPDAPARNTIRQALARLDAEWAGGCLELQEVATGYRAQVRNEYEPWIARLWDEKPPRYSRALLETLAIIAYRQPMTRSEIEEIRGVSVSSQIIRTLTEREWIRVVGHRETPGRPAMYGTTREFLDYFNLKTLDQLPPISDIRDLEGNYPELGFDAEPASTKGNAAEGAAGEERAAPTGQGEDATAAAATGAADEAEGGEGAPQSAAEGPDADTSDEEDPDTEDPGASADPSAANGDVGAPDDPSASAGRTGMASTADPDGAMPDPDTAPADDEEDPPCTPVS